MNKNLIESNKKNLIRTRNIIFSMKIHVFVAPVDPTLTIHILNFNCHLHVFVLFTLTDIHLMLSFNAFRIQLLSLSLSAPTFLFNLRKCWKSSFSELLYDYDSAYKTGIAVRL